MILCPICESKMRVNWTSYIGKSNRVRRTRFCRECRQDWATHEILEIDVRAMNDQYESVREEVRGLRVRIGAVLRKLDTARQNLKEKNALIAVLRRPLRKRRTVLESEGKYKSVDAQIKAHVRDLEARIRQKDSQIERYRCRNAVMAKELRQVKQNLKRRPVLKRPPPESS